MTLTTWFTTLKAMAVEIVAPIAENTVKSATSIVRWSAIGLFPFVKFASGVTGADYSWMSLANVVVSPAVQDTMTVSPESLEGGAAIGGIMVCFQQDLIQLKKPPSEEEKAKQTEDDNKKVIKVKDAIAAVDEQMSLLAWSKSQLAFINSPSTAVSVPEKIKAQIRAKALSQSSERKRERVVYSKRL